MLWHERSWPQLAAIDKNIPVIVPLGSCEQHGHHLPVFVDTLQVDAIANRVESQLKDQVLLTPTLWLGSSHHHKDFAGTLSLTPLLYAQVIQQVALSVIQAGFKKIFFLNGHGGNRTPVADALGDLVATHDRADETYLVLANWWEISAPQIAGKKLNMEQDVISHACEFETSLMLAIRPDLVHPERIQIQNNVISNDWWTPDDDSKTRVGVYRRFHRLTAAGSTGNPAAATEQKGKNLLHAVTAEIVRFIRDFSTWPPLPPIGPQANPGG